MVLWTQFFALISWASQTKLTFQLSNPQDKTLKQILWPLILTHFAEPLPQPFPLVSESQALASLRILSRKQFSFLQKISGCIKVFNSHRADIVVSAWKKASRELSQGWNSAIPGGLMCGFIPQIKWDFNHLLQLQIQLHKSIRVSCNKAPHCTGGAKESNLM